MRENTSIEKRVATGFALALLVLLLVTIAGAWNASKFAATFRWVDHSHQVLYNVEHTLVEVLEVQTSSRGYLLTGDQMHASSYDHALAACRRSLQQLRRLTADNPVQQERLVVFEQNLAAFTTLTRERHEARDRGNAATAIHTLSAGQAIIDRLTHTLRSMEVDERMLLAARSWAFQDASQTTIVIMISGGFLAASLVIIAGLRVRRDFHRRRTAERELQDFFRLATDPMVVLSNSGKILRLNPAWSSTLGHEVEELRGQPFIDLIHPEDLSLAQEQVQRLAIAHEKVFFESRHRTKSGNWRWLQWNAIPSAVDPVIYAAARDVTEHKQAMAALKQSGEEIRDLYNLAPCGYHSLDAEGRFLSINDTELGWLGYTRDEVVGKLRFPDLLPVAHRLGFEESFSRFKVAGAVRDLEFDLQRKDGTVLPVSLSATAILDAHGAYVASRSTLFDITHRKQTEQQIRSLNLDLQLQNARLEIANKELESFSYSVSHDLRAPLRHIDGFASLLAKHAAQMLDDKGRRYIAVISDSAKRMGRLIDDLLTFSRMGRAQMEETEIDHRQLVETVIREGRFERDPPIEWRIAPLPKASGDPAMLRQVWINLIDNAVKYSAHAKPARIEIGNASNSLDPSEVVFFVKDNGVGFDMKYAVKLFGVFQRLHSDSEFEGTGIGLANVRRIITRHGGRTWAESTVGIGSTFYFSLPTAPPSSPAPL